MNKHGQQGHCAENLQKKCATPYIDKSIEAFLILDISVNTEISSIRKAIFDCAVTISAATAYSVIPDSRYIPMLFTGNTTVINTRFIEFYILLWYN